VVIGIDAHDRPGLLLDLSKGLSSLRLNLRHTEASVVGQRSLSVWRCELLESSLPDLEEIWSVLNVSLTADNNAPASIPSNHNSLQCMCLVRHCWKLIREVKPSKRAGCECCEPL
jgi:hypothetical protein